MALLVFSFDGTGNDPEDAADFANDRSITNILKLHILMGGRGETGRTETEDGYLHYYSGIGTLENGLEIPLVGRAVAWLSKVVNIGIAPRWLDARRILEDAEKDLRACRYGEGDRIAVFGFSRGAALARKFASIILKKGIVPKVDFVGVYDTVAAMDGIRTKSEKIHSDVVFENGTLDGRIEKAIHLVALDEERIPFAPTLMNCDEEDGGRILEIWFAGSHGDVGGGFWSDGLSDLALGFMSTSFAAFLGCDASELYNKERMAEFLGDYGITTDDVAVDPQATGTLHENSGIFAKVGYLEPRNVRVNRNDIEDPARKPLVHDSVKERFALVGYRPKALRDKDFRIWRNGCGSSVVHGVDGLGFDLS